MRRDIHKKKSGLFRFIRILCGLIVVGGMAAAAVDVLRRKKEEYTTLEDFADSRQKGAHEGTGMQQTAEQKMFCQEEKGAYVESARMQTTEPKTLSSRRKGIYELFLKRFLDVLLSGLALVLLSPVYLAVALLVRVKLGSSVIFKQERPGKIDAGTGKEKIFCLYKFRSMTDERDENGALLPDSVRLTKFGKWLRSTSLDELPELVNIIKGDMSIVGPRPQLVRDMVFMTKEQRRRHLVRPGLTGLAQVNGRNAISWEDKLKWDLKYIEKITLFADFKIIIQTVTTALIRKEGITEDDMATAEDFGDYLLRAGKINFDEYKNKIKRANSILNAVEELQQ